MEPQGTPEPLYVLNIWVRGIWVIVIPETHDHLRGALASSLRYERAPLTEYQVAVLGTIP